MRILGPLPQTVASDANLGTQPARSVGQGYDHRSTQSGPGDHDSGARWRLDSLTNPGPPPPPASFDLIA